jgi:capsule biosynthesis phosphatase
MAYDKRIIVDFDDTIATTTTRDWNTAIPHWDVINKMNNLYDKGWEVWIVTARGQLSCDGDFQQADEKYRVIIEEWLANHSVKYHKLSFEKRLASYYIDDKAMLPEDFVDLDIREIKTGWSGAKVEKRGDRIFKTHHDSIDAAKWYNMAAPLVNVPIVHSMIGETLSLEYLEDNGAYFKMENVNDAIDKFSLYKTHVSHASYYERINSHCKVNDDFHEIILLLEDPYVQDVLKDKGTFMHGDLSLENIIQTDKGLYFIDPIYREDQWSSYLLDISKMIHSYRKYNRMFEYEVFLNTWVKRGEDEYVLRLLEVTQWIRIIRYAPKDQQDRLKQITKNLLEEIIIKRSHKI